MKAVMPGKLATGEPYEARQLVSDLFHQLSQPLTGLCCSLELALLQPPAADEYSQILKRALAQAEKVSWLATAMRELFEASAAGEDPEVLDLRRAVEEAVGDLLPVAESEGMQLRCPPGAACPVCFDAPRLRQGLFHLLGFIVDSGGRGTVATIAFEDLAGDIMLRLAVSGEGPASRLGQEHPPHELVRRLGLGIARAIFEAAGGSFCLRRGNDSWSIEVQVRGRAQ